MIKQKIILGILLAFFIRAAQPVIPKEDIDFSSPLAWTNGIIIDQQKLKNSLEQLNLSSEQKAEYMYFADILVGNWLLNPKANLDEDIALALKTRHTIAKNLSKVDSANDFIDWKTSTKQLLKKKSRRATNKNVFYTFVGLGEDLINHPPIENSFFTSNSLSWKRPVKPHTETKVIGPSTPIVQTWPGKKYTQREAEKMIQGALLESGLFALKIPLGAFDDYSDVVRASRSIQSMNKALEKRTGLNQALGVKGRVIWALKASETSLVNATSSSLGGEYYVITSTPSSYYHEWMHVFIWVNKNRTPTPLKELESSIRRQGLTAKEWKSLMKEAQHSTNIFFSQKWTGLTIPENIAPQTLYSLSMNRVGSPYNAAIITTHKTWLKNPSANVSVSSWVARRKLADFWLSQSQESIMGKQKYYSLSDEWIAAAWAGEMTMYIEGKRPPELSIIYMPLETEIKAYSPHWDRLFLNERQDWEKMDQAHFFYNYNENSISTPQ